MASFILNIGWSLLGFVVAIISLPIKIKFEPVAKISVIEVKRLWIGEIFLQRRIRGMAFGRIILLSEAKNEFTFAHELIHVRQYDRMPLIFPFLYCLETARVGYEKNRFEEEARFIK